MFAQFCAASGMLSPGCAASRLSEHRYARSQPLVGKLTLGQFRLDPRGRGLDAGHRESPTSNVHVRHTGRLAKNHLALLSHDLDAVTTYSRKWLSFIRCG